MQKSMEQYVVRLYDLEREEDYNDNESIVEVNERGSAGLVRRAVSATVDFFSSIQINHGPIYLSAYDFSNDFVPYSGLDHAFKFSSPKAAARAGMKAKRITGRDFAVQAVSTLQWS